MRVKVQDIGASLHPNERIVEVTTTTGKERLVVDKRALEKNTLSVGSPIAQKDDMWLIELPRETVGGSWRIWVKGRTLIAETGGKRAA